MTLMLLVACSACTSVTPSTRPGGVDTAALEQRAEAQVAAGNLMAAVDLYTQLATMTSGSRRAGYLLEAARLAADYGDTALARRRLAEVRPGAELTNQQALGVLFARLELLEGRPQAALDLLDALTPPLRDSTQRDAAAIRGRALFRLGRQLDAVRTLVEREVWLADSASVLANQRSIWDGFRENPPATALVASGDPIVDGWLALAPLVASSAADLRRALLTWRQDYPTHPAAAGLLGELLAAQRVGTFPRQIALLLPLTSAQRGAALALRDGFMAAHLRDSAHSSSLIRVYDSAALGSAEAYQRAELDGADFIVGPLLPGDVDTIVAHAGFVPTLALNYTSNAAAVQRSFYQYALASADEASAIAAAAAASGAKTALAFVPSNPRGLQIRADFQAAFEAAGGELLGWNSYEPALQDFSQPIAALLNVTRSRDRHRRLAANLGVAVQFPEARRREDIDMIFIVAGASAGRLIAPQLRFFGAANIPTYATPEIFDPASTTRYTDLNGLMFADVPALVAPDDTASSVRRDLQTYWPQRAGLIRLHAMGFDAYGLVGALYAVDNGGLPLRGLSGDLTLDAQGRVHRALPLARFQNGGPVAVDLGFVTPIDTGTP